MLETSTGKLIKLTGEKTIKTVARGQVLKKLAEACPIPKMLRNIKNNNKKQTKITPRAGPRGRPGPGPGPRPNWG